MVEVKKIQVHEQSYVGIKLYMPSKVVHIIYSPTCILVGDYFSLDAFSKEIVILQMKMSDSFESLLNSTCIATNQSDINCEIWKGKDALARFTT